MRSTQQAKNSVQPTLLCTPYVLFFSEKPEAGEPWRELTERPASGQFFTSPSSLPRRATWLAMLSGMSLGNGKRVCSEHGTVGDYL